MTGAEHPQPAPVLLGVEQLRRSVPGGIGTATEGLLRGLGACGPAIRSGVVLYASAPRDASSATPEADPLRAFDLPLLVSPFPHWLATRLWARGRSGPRRPFSLVHATSFHVPPVDAPLVATVHDLGWRHVPEAYGSRGRRWHEAALARIGRRASAFVVPSSSVADDLAASGIDLAGRPVEVIPWGSDHLARPDEPACDALLETLGVDRPFLLTVSTIEPRKNLGRLIEGYRAARAAIPNPPSLLVVGPSGWGGGITGGDGVVLAGHVDPPVLAALYGRAVAFGYVPLHEGFGLPVLEAMRSGVPVLSSPVPSARGGTLLVDPLAVDAIRDGIVTIVTDASVRSALVRSGEALAAEHTWADVARRHLALWRSLGAELPAAEGG
jgi:alpha-1,3-rhamnosyl/mannosyltransferase